MSNRKHAKLDLGFLIFSTISGLIAVVIFLMLPQMTNDNPTEASQSGQMSNWVGAISAMIFYAYYGGGVIGYCYNRERSVKVLLRYAYGWPVWAFVAWWNGPYPTREKSANY